LLRVTILYFIYFIEIKYNYPTCMYIYFLIFTEIMVDEKDLDKTDADKIMQ